MQKKTEQKYILTSNMSIAGVGRSLTKAEWKRIYGYNVSGMANCKFEIDRADFYNRTRK